MTKVRLHLQAGSISRNQLISRNKLLYGNCLYIQDYLEQHGNVIAKEQEQESVEALSRSRRNK